MIIPVNLGKDSYDITLEAGALGRGGRAGRVGEIFDLSRKVLVVTDSGVPGEYGAAVAEAAGAAGGLALVAGIEAGEASKNLGEFERLCRMMLEAGFSRKDCVVAVGGGVVGDLAGFAAACYMRGIDFYNVPTTLLSQVDSSVGGKTAVDLGEVKNIVGAFHQPKAVLIDPEVLRTLDRRQLGCGYAEIVKMAAALDKEFFEDLESLGTLDFLSSPVAAEPAAGGGDMETLEKIISSALRLKIKVVEEDEKETGLRRVLNFGHTLGHGIESVTGLLHGESVALGMLPMCGLAMRGRVRAVLEKAGLPVTCQASAVEVAGVAMYDKKAEGGKVVTVRVDESGGFRLEAAGRQELEDCYREVFER